MSDGETSHARFFGLIHHSRLKSGTYSSSQKLLSSFFKVGDRCYSSSLSEADSSSLLDSACRAVICHVSQIHFRI